MPSQQPMNGWNSHLHVKLALPANLDMFKPHLGSFLAGESQISRNSAVNIRNQTIVFRCRNCTGSEILFGLVSANCSLATSATYGEVALGNPNTTGPRSKISARSVTEQGGLAGSCSSSQMIVYHIMNRQNIPEDQVPATMPCSVNEHHLGKGAEKGQCPKSESGATCGT